MEKKMSERKNSTYIPQVFRERLIKNGKNFINYDPPMKEDGANKKKREEFSLSTNMILNIHILTKHKLFLA
jgi:hypothetical protein